MLTMLVSGLYCGPAHVVETKPCVLPPTTCVLSCLGGRLVVEMVDLLLRYNVLANLLHLYHTQLLM